MKYTNFWTVFMLGYEGEMWVYTKRW